MFGADWSRMLQARRPGGSKLRQLSRVAPGSSLRAALCSCISAAGPATPAIWNGSELAWPRMHGNLAQWQQVCQWRQARLSWCNIPVIKYLPSQWQSVIRLRRRGRVSLAPGPEGPVAIPSLGSLPATVIGDRTISVVCCVRYTERNYSVHYDIAYVTATRWRNIYSVLRSPRTSLQGAGLRPVLTWSPGRGPVPS